MSTSMCVHVWGIYKLHLTYFIFIGHSKQLNLTYNQTASIQYVHLYFNSLTADLHRAHTEQHIEPP